MPGNKESTLEEQIRELVQGIVEHKAHTDFHELMIAIDKLFEQRIKDLDKMVDIKVNERINDIIYHLNLDLRNQLNRMKNKEVI